MKLVQAYIQPNRLSAVTLALHGVPGVSGITVTDVRGWGRGRNQAEMEHPEGLVGDFEKQAKIELLCDDDIADKIVRTVHQVGHTGLRGDGIVYVLSVEAAVRISTGERDDQAIR